MIVMLMAGMLVAAPLSAVPDTTPPPSEAMWPPTAPAVRIPGTRLKLGESLAEIDSIGSYSAVTSGGATARKGPCRFFGLDAEAMLWFEGDRLSHALLTVNGASSHSTDYVQDQLRRLGYRPRRDSPGGTGIRFEGKSAMRVLVDIAKGRLSAHVLPGMIAVQPTVSPMVATIPDSAPVAARDKVPQAPPPTPTDAPRALARADTVPFLPVTLDLDRPVGSYAAPQLVDRAVLDHPRYPAAARSAGVQGMVSVSALVDTSGVVSEATVVHSIHELDDAALEAVRQCRFRSYTIEGRRCRFRTVIRVLFMLD